MLVLAASITAGYLFGSITTAIWVARWVGGIDICEHGSGNAGATNVARVLGLKWGLIVGVIDILKGFVPVFSFGKLAGPAMGLNAADAGLMIGAAAIIGHLYPIFAGFKGGKGVLTALGVFAALMPFEASMAALVWAVIFAATRIVSLGSIFASLALPVFVFIRRFALGVNHPPSLLVASVLIAALVVFTHRSNIRRLLSRTESGFHQK